MREPISVRQVYPHREFICPVGHGLFRQSACASIHIIALGQPNHA